jgi:hypothetical protein
MIHSGRIGRVAAAALLGVTAMLVAAGPAQAEAVSTSPYTLTFDNMSYTDSGVRPVPSFQGLINELDGFLAKTSMSQLNLNRVGAASGCVAGVPASVTSQRCWESGDNASSEWWPQGVTTSNDGNGGAPSRILVSWYDNCSTGNFGDAGCTTAPTDHRSYSKGVRLSVYDAASRAYRLVILVEPFINASGNATYKAVKIHAGGIVWYGNYLYVADTSNGLRVFDTTQMFDLGSAAVLPTDISDNTQIGRQSGVFYSHAYRYILPQVGNWDQAGTPTTASSCDTSGPAKYSYIGLDRTSNPDKLVAGEYCNPTTAAPTLGRIARWNIGAGLSAALNSGAGTAFDAHRLPQSNLQGGVSVGNRFYLNRSNGQSNGTLWRYDLSGGTFTAPASRAAPTGPEDLSYNTFDGNLYSATEYVSGRMMYTTNGF